MHCLLERQCLWCSLVVVCAVPVPGPVRQSYCPVFAKLCGECHWTLTSLAGTLAGSVRVLILVGNHCGHVEQQLAVANNIGCC